MPALTQSPIAAIIGACPGTMEVQNVRRPESQMCAQAITPTVHMIVVDTRQVWTIAIVLSATKATEVSMSATMHGNISVEGQTGS